jgi:hypothetical protein
MSYESSLPLRLMWSSRGSVKGSAMGSDSGSRGVQEYLPNGLMVSTKGSWRRREKKRRKKNGNEKEDSNLKVEENVENGKKEEKNVEENVSNLLRMGPMMKTKSEKNNRIWE